MRHARARYFTGVSGCMGYLLAAALGAFVTGCASDRSTDALVAQLLAEDAKTVSVSPVRATKLSADSPPPKADNPPDLPSRNPAPVGTATTPGESTMVTIQPDAVVQITVKEDSSLNGRYTVNDFSAIDFGYVGLVILQDMTPDEAAAKIKSVLESRYLHSATVTVKINKASYDRIEVSGEVVQPGLLKIGPGSSISLNDAILRSGGLKPQAANAKVKIIRGGIVNAFRAAAEGDILPLVSEEGKPQIPDIYLQNNDLVYVFAYQPGALGEKKILLLGEVTKPGIVLFASDEPCTLMYLLFKIGGLPRWADAKNIQIKRRDKAGAEVVIRADADVLLKEGNPKDDVPLENGDKVVVPQAGIKFL